MTVYVLLAACMLFLKGSQAVCCDLGAKDGRKGLPERLVAVAEHFLLNKLFFES